jgi:hypothetical protein
VEVEPKPLESLARPAPVAFRGRVQTLRFRDGLLVAGAILLIGAGTGLVSSPLLTGAASGSPDSASGGSLAPSGIPVESSASVSPSASGIDPSFPPGPTPAVTPGGHCDRGEFTGPLGASLITTLDRSFGAPAGSTWLPTPLPASPDGGAIAPDGGLVDGDPVLVGLASPVSILIENRGCALEWRIALDGVVVEARANAAMDSGYAEQGLFHLSIPTRLRSRAVLRLDAHLRQGWTTVVWSLEAVPDGYFVSAGLHATAWTPCAFATVPTIPRDCRGLLIGEPNDELRVSPGSVIAWRVPGAGLEAARDAALRCVEADPSGATFVAVASCPVESSFDEAESFTFLAPSVVGHWLVELSGCAVHGLGRACGTWYAQLTTDRSGATDSPPR